MLLGVVVKNWLHQKSSAIFWITLVIYILIWATVSYVGVYVTYVAAPLLLISGLIMFFSKPNDSA